MAQSQQNDEVSTANDVAAAAKQLLQWYGVNQLTLFPYELIQQNDCLIINRTDDRGTILVEQENKVESNLQPFDYDWFQTRLKMLKDP